MIIFRVDEKEELNGRGLRYSEKPFPFMLARLMELIHPLHQLPRHPCEKAPSFIRREKRVVSMEQATYIEIRLTGKKP